MSTAPLENEGYGDSEMMGPLLRQFVEQQLIDDLGNYKIFDKNLRFDWSKSCGEGHSTEYLDGNLENFSYISVYNTNNSLVATGWLDFVNNFWDTGAERQVIVFWDFVDTFNEGKILEGKKTDNGIPDHIWNKLDESSKAIWKDYRLKKNPLRFL